MPNVNKVYEKPVETVNSQTSNLNHVADSICFLHIDLTFKDKSDKILQVGERFVFCQWESNYKKDKE